VAVPSANDVGIGVVVSFGAAERLEAVGARFEGAPREEQDRHWTEGLQANRKARRLPLLALQGAFGVLLVLAIGRSRRAWIGLTLAVLAVPAATVLSAYYLMFFVVSAALLAVRSSFEPWLYLFAASVQVLMTVRSFAAYYDDRSLVVSIAYVGAATALTLAVARR
jgi:hypothetical protein